MIAVTASQCQMLARGKVTLRVTPVNLSLDGVKRVNLSGLPPRWAGRPS